MNDKQYPNINIGNSRKYANWGEEKAQFQSLKWAEISVIKFSTVHIE